MHCPSFGQQHVSETRGGGPRRKRIGYKRRPHMQPEMQSPGHPHCPPSLFVSAHQPPTCRATPRTTSPTCNCTPQLRTTSVRTSTTYVYHRSRIVRTGS
ncbi:hypothetical protein PENSPDRAFT_455853 [Peniophora sp. CONT]|nr:hypothetical protein PENSPDRAFT_455853 [Peniophora sp. CONT]